jgi:subtilisin-like proprotein convertase family protein
VQGSWTLTVKDTAVNARSGALLNWTLDLYTEGVPEPQGNP